MKSLNVVTATHNYPVVIGKGLRHHVHDYLKKDYSKIFIITDDIVSDLYLEDIKKGLPQERTFSYSIPHGETSKSIRFYYELQTQLLEHELDRASLIIALGGGVVGDLAGFVASTFMRGIDYIQIPTTILAHDSSVGGKVAINHELGKNLIGSFYPPQAVIYDVDTLKTLPENEIRSGYAEIVKEAYIADETFLQELLNIDLAFIDDELLMNHLYKGIQIKAHIVEADEREASIRKHLNFGHTLAHAIERELAYGTIAHGEAVAIGMLFALKLTQKQAKGQFYESDYLKWLKINEFPLHIPLNNAQQLMSHMKKDKKTHHNILQFVLLNKVGQPFVTDVDEADILLELTAFTEELNDI